MTTINIATWCRRCGAEFVADRRAIVSGAWRLCPACRDEPPRVPAVRPGLRPTADRPRSTERGGAALMDRDNAMATVTTVRT